MTPTLFTGISAPTSAWMAASNSAFVTVGLLRRLVLRWHRRPHARRPRRWPRLGLDAWRRQRRCLLRLLSRKQPDPICYGDIPFERTDKTTCGIS